MKLLDENYLGICIPTYNREKYLAECINSILSGVSQFSFPIYISDNASSDNTEELMERFRATYNRIEYNRNKSNLGLYRNILNVIKMAKTKYIWIVGDDDAAQENALIEIVRHLENGHDFLVLNSTPYDNKLEKYKARKFIPCKFDKLYPKSFSRELLGDLKKNAYHGFISSMVIKTEFIQKLIPKYENPTFVLYNNIWFPTALFYEAILEKSGMFVCEPLIKNRANLRPSDKDFWNYLYVDHIKAVDYLRDVGYDNKFLRRAIDSNLLSMLYIMVNAKFLHRNIYLLNRFLTKTPILPIRTKLLILSIDSIPFFILKRIRNILWRNKS